MVMVATLLIRIPLPAGGYLNFGDIVIVFTGLYAGSKAGLIAGGLGSALADLIGFPVYAPITLVVKGLEGLVCGFGYQKKGFLSFFAPLVGVLTMVTGYFVFEVFYPQTGVAGAIVNLPGNLIQAVSGYLGGRLLYQVFIKLEL